MIPLRCVSVVDLALKVSIVRWHHLNPRSIRQTVQMFPILPLTLAAIEKSRFRRRTPIGTATIPHYQVQRSSLPLFWSPFGPVPSL